jgi:hypothetical protein
VDGGSGRFRNDSCPPQNKNNVWKRHSDEDVGHNFGSARSNSNTRWKVAAVKDKHAVC